MTSLLLASEKGLEALAYTIAIVVLVIGVSFAIVSALAGVWKLVLVSRYNRFNKQQVTANMTGAEVAEKMLQALGLNDVKVEKLGFWKSIFVGNSYNPRKKAIRLRSNIYDKTSLTAVALAAQKVVIAKRHHDGDKKIASREVLKRFGYFAPFALIPLIFIGIVLDLVIWTHFGWLSIAFTIFAFAYFIASFIVVILNLKIEKAACKTALEYIQKINLLTENEVEDANLLYKTYITDYWLEFIYDILFILWEIIKLLGRILFSRGKK